MSRDEASEIETMVLWGDNQPSEDMHKCNYFGYLELYQDIKYCNNPSVCPHKSKDQHPYVNHNGKVGGRKYECRRKEK